MNSEKSRQPQIIISPFGPFTPGGGGFFPPYGQGQGQGQGQNQGPAQGQGPGPYPPPFPFPPPLPPYPYPFPYPPQGQGTQSESGQETQTPSQPGQGTQTQQETTTPSESGTEQASPNYSLVKIRSVFNNLFVRLGDNNTLYATGNSADEGVTLRVIPVNSYQVKLRVDGGRFVRVNDNNLLVADTNNNNATIFNRSESGDREISLMAPNGYYVRVRDRDNVLVARAQNAGPRTKFRFEQVTQNPEANYSLVKIKSVFNNSFVILGYNNILYAMGGSVNEGVTFRLIPVNSYQVKLRVDGGRFVRVNDNNLLVADTNNNNAAIFNQSESGDMEYSLMAPNGYYVRVRDRDNALVARAENAGPRTKFKFRRVNR
ncbi:fascin domain-containing protein [Terrisporobacter sp.]